MSLQLISLTSLACTWRPFILFFQHAKLSPTTGPLRSQPTLSPACDTVELALSIIWLSWNVTFSEKPFLTTSPDTIISHNFLHSTYCYLKLSYLLLNSLLSLTWMEAPEGHRLCPFCLRSTMGHNRPSVNSCWINRQKNFGKSILGHLKACPMFYLNHAKCSCIPLDSSWHFIWSP